MTIAPSKIKKVIGSILLLAFFAMLASFIQTKSQSSIVEQATTFPDQNMTDLMEKLQQNPNNSKVLLELGQLFFAAEEYARATIFFNRAIVAAPSDPNIRYWVSVSLFHEGNIPAAAEALEELLLLERQPNALYNLGILYKYRLDKNDKAKELFKELLQIETTDQALREKVQKELAPRS